MTSEKFMAVCVWCDGTGRILETGVLCRICGGSSKRINPTFEGINDPYGNWRRALRAIRRERAHRATIVAIARRWR